MGFVRCFPTLPAVALFGAALLSTPSAEAQGGNGNTERLLKVEYTPTERAQIAIWIEDSEGNFLTTVRLTQATAFRGIGNRPGAYAMNSGFRWPYGRREGVLPVWGYRRANAPGAKQFPMVIFQDRISEGHASRSSNDQSRDDYFCLSFNKATTAKDALDAVTCASVFNSDKGRFLTETDVGNNYAEPMGDENLSMRPLPLKSLYPPRRDVSRCVGGGCNDHPDLDKFDDVSREAMPEIDAVTMATPAGNQRQVVQYTIPDSWPDGDYVMWLEVNTEGDYNDVYNDETYPTPEDPSQIAWDMWAQNYGYPYRGQPSAVYSVPFTLGEYNSGSALEPVGAGSIDGTATALNPVEGTLTDDPVGAPGSGADRLRVVDGQRVTVEVIPKNVCGGTNPPPECGAACSDSDPCSLGFICNQGACTGYCDEDMAPSKFTTFIVEPHPDEKESHHFGIIRFSVPESIRSLAGYEVRVGTQPIVDQESFLRAQPANAALIESVALDVPVEGEPGAVIEIEFGGMSPETEYWVAMRAFDDCNDSSDVSVAQIRTTPINFTTVNPCFVATAAYGDPMADDIWALRRFRDNYLKTNAPGRLFVKAYYSVGPHLAEVIEKSDSLRTATRWALKPLVEFARWLES